jgi:hypothetical protein
MIAYVLYAPPAVALAVLLLYSARGAVRGHGHGRLVPLALLLAADLGGSLYLMFGVGEPWARWAAVGLVGVVAVPLLGPAAIVVAAVIISWVTGKPIRWN